MWASNLDSVLDGLNKGKRKKLARYLQKMSAARDSYVYCEQTPKGARQDDGRTVLIFVSVQSVVRGERELHIVIDSLDDDGQETFTECNASHNGVASLMSEITPAQTSTDRAAMSEPTAENSLPTYNPETHCLYPKDKFGRPKPLTDDERAQIRTMREQGYSINGIAQELHRGNRIIMQYCREIEQ